MIVILRIALLALALGLAAAYVIAGASHQWDFETYYYAASAYRAGLDPYLLQSLTTVAGKPIELPFIYPPATLLLFVPFSYLPLGTASLVWLSLKCVLAGILVWIWRKEFLRFVAPDLVLVTALLGFDLALLWDLRTGNVSLVEQALLWSGFFAYVRGRFSVAAVLIGLASVFKLGPIVFLALFLSPLGERNRVAPIVLGLVAFVSLIVVPLVPFASWTHALTAAFGQGSLTPNSDPSAPTVLGWVLSLAGTPPSSAPWIQASLYALFVIVVISASVAALRRADRSFSPADRVVTAMVLWFLLSPRVMVYSYASAVVPTLFILYRTIQGRAWRLGAGLLLLLQALIRFLPGQPPMWLGVVSFLIMVATWVLWVRRETAPAV
jgi:alpha-1,2-mannosyltransferase